MATRGEAALCHLEFTVLVEVADEPCELVWEDDVTAAAVGQNILHTIRYRGGTGGLQTDEWNIFLYDRSDDLPNGTARAAGTLASPLASGLPAITDETPGAPLPGKPVLTADEQTAYNANPTAPAGIRSNVYIGPGGKTDTWWRGSFRWLVPSETDADAIRMHETATFYGRIEMVRNT